MKGGWRCYHDRDLGKGFCEILTSINVKMEWTTNYPATF